MTRRDHILQWAAYGAALLLTLFLQNQVLARLPVFGVIPILLPLALAACATLEGPRAGAGFGIAVGALMSVATGGGFWRLVVCSAAGFLTGLITRHVLRQDFIGHLICCSSLMFLRFLWVVGVRVVGGVASLSVLLRVAIPEFLWSMVFAAPVYALFLFVCKKWGRIYYA